ncbi:WSC domain-containing protein [Coniochaeta sp. 2T2.1]|nr:WSC domain-containing protein [Coniochaeta sp. 2T2.1]
MCPLSQASAASIGGTTPSPQQVTGSAASMTTFLTSSPSFIPPAGGWAYAGCYRDDPNRALKNYSITDPVAGGMTNERCIRTCRDNNFSIAGTEDGFQCFCGNALVDSMLIGDTHCNMTCDGGGSGVCGGPWALSLYSLHGQVSQVNGPGHQFTLPQPLPGHSDVSVFAGGIAVTVVQVTTAVEIWPPLAESVLTFLTAGPSPVGSSTTSWNSSESTSSGYSAGVVPEVKSIMTAAISGEYHVTPTTPADSVFMGSTVLPGTASDKAVAAQSPTEFGKFSGYAHGTPTPGPKLRYKGLLGRYRGAMPFIA